MKTWWGRFELPTQQWYRWTIGPLHLWIRRDENEWRVASARDRDSLATGMESAVPVDPPDEAGLDVLRFGIRRTTPRLELVPVASDRAALVRSERPFQVPPREQVTIFLSTPVFVRLMVDGHESLVEMPTVRLSDTWFGASTREGELCYAVKTSARFHLENLPVRPHRAVSEVLLENRAETALLLERMRLPLTHLGLYEVDGRLWTESITIRRTGDGDSAEVDFSGEPPSRVAGALLLGPRRSRPERRLSLRIFSGLVRRSEG